MIAVEKPTLKDGEILFLKKYAQCMKLIAPALDRLQGSKECLMDELIPSIRSVKKKLEEVALRTKLVYCQALAEGVIIKLEEKFSKALSFESGLKQDMLASVKHSFFKSRWAPAGNPGLLQKMLVTAVNDVLTQKKRREREREGGGRVGKNSDRRN